MLIRVVHRGKQVEHHAFHWRSARVGLTLPSGLSRNMMTASCHPLYVSPSRRVPRVLYLPASSAQTASRRRNHRRGPSRQPPSQTGPPRTSLQSQPAKGMFQPVCWRLLPKTWLRSTLNIVVERVPGAPRPTPHGLLASSRASSTRAPTPPRQVDDVNLRENAAEEPP